MTSIGACLAQLPSGDLSRYRAVLSGIATAERRGGHYSSAVWYTVLCAACEAEQRRRTRTDTELPDTEAALRVVLRSLADDQVAALLTQYRELAGIHSSTQSVRALARLATTCAALLDAALVARRAVDAQTASNPQITTPRAGWRPDVARRPVAAAVARDLVPRAHRRSHHAG